MIKALTILLWIYLSGAALMALIFLAIHLRLNKPELRNLHHDMMKIAPRYILLWFWQLIMLFVMVHQTGGWKAFRADVSRTAHTHPTQAQ